MQSSSNAMTQSGLQSSTIQVIIPLNEKLFSKNMIDKKIGAFIKLVTKLLSLYA